MIIELTDQDDNRGYYSGIIRKPFTLNKREALEVNEFNFRTLREKLMEYGYTCYLIPS